MSIEAEQLKQIYEKILLSTKGFEKTTKLKIEFYPYVGINNKIRLRDNLIHVKLSDLLHDAPIEFHQALAEILVKKLYRKRVSLSALEIYRDYVKQTQIRNKSLESKKTRGRKVLSSSQGEHYNLDEVFTFLNQIYFDGKIPTPQLSWSATKTYRRLGHHDSAHEAIVISKSLDNLHVPRFVVEYVVYHEMLHIKHPTRYENGRSYNHTPAFRRDEKEFLHFDKAEEWIEKNLSKISPAKPRKSKRAKNLLRRLLDF